MKNQKNTSDRAFLKFVPKKSKFYFGLLLVGVALMVGGLMKGKFQANNSDNGELNQEEIGEINNNSGQNYVEGFLGLSDDSAKGNLKLVSGDKVVYLRTGRDFSALIGAEVLVFIDGTIDSFKLLDVQGKIEKDGFIKSN